MRKIRRQCNIWLCLQATMKLTNSWKRQQKFNLKQSSFQNSFDTFAYQFKCVNRKLNLLHYNNVSHKNNNHSFPPRTNFIMHSIILSILHIGINDIQHSWHALLFAFCFFALLCFFSALLWIFVTIQSNQR